MIMEQYFFMSLNGRTTSYSFREFVKRKTMYASKSTNNWSSTENSTNNSWNVNFSTGNANNNNNKYNTNYVRAVAELSDNEKVEWILAYDECCSNKMTSKQCTLYRTIAEKDLFRLAAEVKSMTYVPTTSITFLVTRPKLREIFAADFRDRIVQHWIIMKVGGLIEQRFVDIGNVSYNCRKNFGTGKAVSKLAENINEITQGYTKNAYIGKYDLKSFFMSVDIKVLWELLEKFLRANYKDNDIELVLYTIKVTIFHRPQLNCVKRGVDLWDKLDPSKSLLGRTDYIGMPIGNITSQIFANFYLSFLDELVVKYCNEHNGKYIRFVDDFVLVFTNLDDLNYISKFIETWISENLHIKMHVNKRSIQKAYNGVSFVGSYIKPNRIYLSERTLSGFYNAIESAEGYCKSHLHNHRQSVLEQFIRIQCTLNSYLGFTRTNKSYLKKLDFIRKCNYLWEVFDVDINITKFKIKKEYQLKYNIYGKYRAINKF